MAITRAKSLSNIYQEVRGYDLVLVPDAPLAGALNRHLDRAHMGDFATTPRRRAAGGREPAEDRTAFLELVTVTNLDWKRAAYEIGNILQCWEHQGRLGSILEYETYVDGTTATVVEKMADLETTSRRLTEYVIDPELDIAVVGIDQFTALERSILPEEYDQIDPFDDDSFDVPPMHVFDSATAIVDTLLDSISPETADKVAVVLDRGSEFSPLVESGLEAAGIPFYGGPGFVDDPDHRAFVQLLRTGQAGTDTRIREVRPLVTHLGLDVPVEHDKKRLGNVDLPELDWLQAVASRMEEWTFEETLTRFETRARTRLDGFREELETLGIADAPITERGVEQLAFYVQTYEVPVDRDDEGVVLADATAAAHVARPLVFYLGLDEGWTHSPPDRPWVDGDAQYTRNVQQFQLLLQNGVEQRYLVRDTAGGVPVTPCLYFEELLAESVDRFSDLDSVTHTRFPGGGASEFDREPVGVEPAEIDTISQSTLGTYVNSPRDYVFDRVVDRPDEDYFREGTLFHDFAEFYANHPDAVDEETLDEVVDVMLAELEPFHRELHRDVHRTRYRSGLEVIASFLDEHPPIEGDVLTANSGWGGNVFAEYFERPVDSPITERWFEETDLGMKGKIDLIHRPTRLLDYKSSAKKSAYQVVTRSATDPPADTPDFQALMYLTYFRTQQPDERLEFTFLHFMEPLDDLVTGEADLEDALTTVGYIPETFDSFIASREAYDALLDGYNDCVETFDDLGFLAYREIIQELSFPETTETDDLRDSKFMTEFEAAVDGGTVDSVDAAKGCDQAMRTLNRIRQTTYFREDLDAFETFVADRIAELNRRRRGEERFPVDGPGGEPHYRWVNHRDLILEDD